MATPDGKPHILNAAGRCQMPEGGLGLVQGFRVSDLGFRV